jgi:hypothetical protein
MSTYQPVAVSESRTLQLESGDISPGGIKRKSVPSTKIELNVPRVVPSSIRLPTRAPLQETKQNERKKWSHYFGSDNWTLEILACALAILTILATVILLNHYNGHPAPVVLRYSVTLGSILSIFATVIKAALYVPLSASISQIIWSKLRQGHRPLSDIAVYDNASRGVIGGIMLLWNRRGRSVPQFK